MSIDISSRNSDRLRATAQAEGVTVDAYVERLLNEREEFAAIVDRSAERARLAPEDARARIECGFLESERGDTVDGEAFISGLLEELDSLGHKRRAG